MAQTFDQWLQSELDRREWKQVDLARASNGVLKIATISKWVRGASKPEEHALITALALALRLSIEEVQRAIREEEGEGTKVPRSQDDLLAELGLNAAVPIPMITDLVAHMGSGGGFVDDYVYLTPEYRRRQKSIIGIYTTGNCMAPEIKDGDAVIFDREEPCEPDDVVVAAVDGQAIVRRLVEVSGRMVLRADADGTTHALTDRDAIVGKVIWVMHRMVRAPRKNGRTA